LFLERGEVARIARRHDFSDDTIPIGDDDGFAGRRQTDIFAEVIFQRSKSLFEYASSRAYAEFTAAIPRFQEPLAARSAAFCWADLCTLEFRPPSRPIILRK
jgi:hypothetical protein